MATHTSASRLDTLPLPYRLTNALPPGPPRLARPRRFGQRLTRHAILPLVIATSGWGAALAEPVERILPPVAVSASQVHTQQTPIAARDGRVFIADLTVGPSGDGDRTTDLVTNVRRGIRRANGTWRWDAEPVELRTVYSEYHSTPAIGVDESGRIHVGYNMHNFPWQYSSGATANRIDDLSFRGQAMSQAEFDAYAFENRTGFPTLGSADIPGNQVTYPAFYNAPDGQLYVTYRFAARPARDFADRRFSTGLARYDRATDAWESIGGPVSAVAGRDFEGTNADRSRVRAIASASGWTSYTPRLAFAPDGSMIVSLFWRRGIAGATTSRACVIRSEDGIDWTTLDGTPVTMPLSPSDCGNVPTATASAYFSVTDVAMGPGGEFHLLTSPVGESRRIHRWTGNGWVDERSPDGAREILFDRDGNLWAFGSFANVHVKRAGETEWETVYSDPNGNDCDPRAALDTDGRTAFVHTFGCNGSPEISVLRLELDSLLGNPRDPDAPDFDELLLRRGEWVQFALPFEGEAQTVDSVFGATLPTARYGDDWVVYRYDGLTQTYNQLALTDALDDGVGYWAIQDVTGSVAVRAPLGAVAANTVTDARCPTASCVSSDIDQQRDGVVWSIAGYSGDVAIALDALRVTSTEGPCIDGCTLEQAGMRSQLAPALYRFDPASGSYDPLDAGSGIDAWDGFWVVTPPAVRGDVELLFGVD